MDPRLTSAIGRASARAPSVLMSLRLPPLSNYWQFAPRDHRRVSSVQPRGGRMNDQLFLNEKLERAVPFHVNGVSEIVVNCWKHGDDHATLVVVGCIIDLLANCKLRHRELLLELSKI
jgi:hypothetical protein